MPDDDDRCAILLSALERTAAIGRVSGRRTEMLHFSCVIAKRLAGIHGDLDPRTMMASGVVARLLLAECEAHSDMGRWDRWIVQRECDLGDDASKWLSHLASEFLDGSYDTSNGAVALFLAKRALFLAREGHDEMPARLAAADALLDLGRDEDARAEYEHVAAHADPETRWTALFSATLLFDLFEHCTAHIERLFKIFDEMVAANALASDSETGMLVVDELACALVYQHDARALSVQEAYVDATVRAHGQHDVRARSAAQALRQWRAEFAERR